MKRPEAKVEALKIIENLIEARTNFEVKSFYDEIVIDTKFGDFVFSINEEEGETDE